MRGVYVLSVPLAVLACDTSCVFTQSPLVYDGSVSKDVFGRVCDHWNFTDATQGIDPSHNFCRLWSGSVEFVPWCYVGNYQKLSFCDTGSFVCPLCANPPIAPAPKPILSLPCRLSPTPQQDPRIVGGAQVTNYEYQFFASIYLRFNLPVSAFLTLSASLIHPNYVLTTFINFASLPPRLSQTVYLGARASLPSQITDRQCFEAHSFTPSQVHCHPLGSDEYLSAYSWCLIRLTTPSKYKPVRLLSPEAEAYLEEDLEAVPLMLTVLGLGVSDYVDPSHSLVNKQNFLHKAFMPVSDFARCADFYATTQATNLVPDSQFCLGYENNPPNSSSYGDVIGDLGGPVVTHRKGDYWQVGLVAQFGQVSDPSCPSSPAVFSRVNSQAFRDWVCSTPSPTKAPSTRPSKIPSLAPTHRPTKSPTNRPTKRPTGSPVSRSPTHAPTRRPTRSPSLTKPPTNQPTKKPTKSPTMRPTKKPTHNPTTRSPSRSPSTRGPTLGRPTRMPTERPTKRPTKSPATRSPTKSPSTRSPTNRPSKRPTKSPSSRSPTKSPTTRSPTSPPRPLCSYLYPPLP